MASLRLTFPEKDEPSVIALTGARLTIGRLPFNTIQIIDRTVSGFHAELISEHGHYRLHDRDSSNGTFVNGERVTDFHLIEPCAITFGTVEAQFSPEAVAVNEDVENFPTRSEINAVRKENAELKATVEVLREESNALRMARPHENGDAALAVSQAEFDKIVVEREALKEERLKQDEELARIKTDLAVLKRDRVNLQLAYDGLQREITDLRAKAGGVEEIALPPKAAAAALAAQAPAPGEEVRIQVPVRATAPAAGMVPPPLPKPAAPKPPASKPPASTPPAAESPAETPAPTESGAMPEAPEPGSETVAAPVRPTVPVKPVAPLRPAAPPKPADAPIFTRIPAAAPAAPKAPSGPMKPFAPLPKAPEVAATVVARPVGSMFASPGVPNRATGTAQPVAAPTAKPTGATQPTPAPAARPTVSAQPVPPPTAKPPGTDVPASPVAPGIPSPPKAPIGLGTGIRPLSKPPGAVPEAKGSGAEALPAAPTTRLSPRPAPGVKLPAQPAPQVGPKGTQKIS